jgi:hypothetical protein
MITGPPPKFHGTRDILRPVRRSQPDRAAVSVCAEVDPGDDGHAVERHTGKAGGDETSDVGGLHRADVRAAGSAARPGSRRERGLV